MFLNNSWRRHSLHTCPMLLFVFPGPETEVSRTNITSLSIRFSVDMTSHYTFYYLLNTPGYFHPFPGNISLHSLHGRKSTFIIDSTPNFLLGRSVVNNDKNPVPVSPFFLLQDPSPYVGSFTS